MFLVEVVGYIVEKHDDGEKPDNGVAADAIEHQVALSRKIFEPCHHCGREVEQGERHGLDRVVCHGPYDDANTVSSCWPCNWRRHLHPVAEFWRVGSFVVFGCVKKTRTPSLNQTLP